MLPRRNSTTEEVEHAEIGDGDTVEKEEIFCKVHSRWRPRDERIKNAKVLGDILANRIHENLKSI